MPGERLVCVWEAAYANDQNPGLRLKPADLKVVTLAFAHLPGSCVHLSAKKFDELFPDEVVDFQAYKNFVQYKMLAKGMPHYVLEEEIEKVCWAKCKGKYVEYKWKISCSEIFHLWQMFLRLAEENTYPPVMLQDEVEWLVEIMAAALRKGWRQPDVGDGATFQQLMRILETQIFEDQKVAVIKNAIDELHNWIVLEIYHAGWLMKRTHKQANWTNWIKQWFILKPEQLLCYDGPSRKNLKGDISIMPTTIIESMSNYRGFARTLKNRFRVDNAPHLEIELCAADSMDKTMWMEALKTIVDASNVGMTPVQAQINTRRRHRKESLQKTERQMKKNQKTARKIQEAQKDEQEGNKEPPNKTPLLKESLRVSHPGNVSVTKQSEIEETVDNNMYAYQKDKIRKVFLQMDTDGNGKIDLEEFAGFIQSLGVQMSENEVKLLFCTIDLDDSGFVCLNEFEDYFLHFILDETGYEQGEEEKKANSNLVDKLKSLYSHADVAELSDYLRNRWEVFGSFKRLGGSGEVVMEGTAEKVSDVVPGEYSLADLACFSDLPLIIPKHAAIKNFQWVSGKGLKSGRAIFPVGFNGKLPIEIATHENVSYYGASLCDSNEVKVSLSYRHGIQDFLYQNQYLDDYVTNEKVWGGAGIEKHDFCHLDCPLDDDSGYFVMGKLDGDELHLTAFKVPIHYTLYVPGGTIHSNDYLKGTWRTMLSDEAEIDHVLICKRSKSDKDGVLTKFIFELVDKI